MPYNLSAGRCCSLIFCSLLQSPCSLGASQSLCSAPSWGHGLSPTHKHSHARIPTHSNSNTHTHTHVPNLYTYIDKLRRLPFRFFLLCFTCLAVLCLMDLCFDVQTVYTILGSTTAQPYMWMCVCWSVYIRDHHLQSWAFFPSAMWRP